YGLIFERFLNPERISMPDIDTDFPDDKRDDVIEYVKNKYGKRHVGHIITFGTLKAKQVLRDVGRVLDYPNREIDSICKSIPNVLDMNLAKAYNEVPLFRQKIESSETNRRLYRIARKLEFNPRHESTHAGGIVFSRKALEEVVPITLIEEDMYSTQYTMEHLEELGLIKMDFLGLRNLSIIAEICDEINQKQEFDIRKIPLDDQRTFKLIQDVNVMGIFQLESAGMRNLIRKMKPRSFEEIAMCIALFRPGPMKNIPIFLENRANPQNVHYYHEDLREILEETYGIIVYQEQIINIARKMAGFSYGKADILRKAMSKKKQSELEKLGPDFINGCIANRYDRKLAEDVYALIMEFANYGFNKSHSIAYGLLAYQLSYLKANYPLYFYKSLLNGVTGSQSKTYDYISECMSIGQKVKGISINDSDVAYVIKDDSIVMPFVLCKDVGMISAEKIVNERRQNGPYKEYVEAIRRLTSASIEKNVIESLICAGAFDELGHSRNTMLSSLNNVLMYANAHIGEISLMADFDDAPIIEELHDDMLVAAEKEKEVLGFYFTFNPIAAVKKKYNIVTPGLDELAMTMGYASGFGLIQRVKQIKTRKGDLMAFVDLVDDKGALSLAVMPNLYSQHAPELVKGKYVLFEGKIEKEASCLVKKMQIL
ncbi:MAG: DNA polymerase III subunit alpha, partial [Erysipelotrichaceae bacterium]|nr:DNA polymerase III subunit alpha [Erysipelotrichaceae bacterium]